MSDGWMELIARGRVTGYTTDPGAGSTPLPADVPCDDPLVQACRELGEPVYPVHEMDGWGTAL